MKWNFLNVSANYYGTKTKEYAVNSEVYESHYGLCKDLRCNSMMYKETI